MSDRVAIDITDGVADVRLNRPDKMNGLDMAMFEAIIEAGESLQDNPSLRAVVLRGEGRCFCAGLDFADFMTRTDGGAGLLARDGRSPANVAQRAAWIWNEVPVPVIAAIHGVAYGGGCQIALGCDLRYVARDAKMSVMEIKWGLIPDMGITKTLLRVLPMDVAKELTFTGRVLEGEEAARVGLATRSCDDPRQEALAVATEIAGKSPDAIRRGKRLFDRSMDLNVADAFVLETELQLEVLGKTNQLEAVQANMMKRAPEFIDPS